MSKTIMPSSRKSVSQPSANNLTLLHTSDIHLGVTPEYSKNGWFGLELAVKAAHMVTADAILIAGDLFETSLTHPEGIKQCFNILSEAGIPVVILPGNHDGDVFERNVKIKKPSNIYILSKKEGESINLNQIHLTVWGKPNYEHNPEFKPLGGLPKRPKQGWYVVIAHGLAVTGTPEGFRSSFITKEELALADCDYIALGHIDSFQDMTAGAVPAYYSGSPFLPNPTFAVVRLHSVKPTDVATLRLYKVNGVAV